MNSNNFESVYSSNNFDNGKKYEQKKMNENYKQFTNNASSNIIPERHNENLYKKEDMDFNIQKPQKEFYSQLTGSLIENFKHNNMQPFYKGDKAHITDNFDNSSFLDRHQGNNTFYNKKKEVKSFTDKTTTHSFVNGMPNLTLNENYNNRFIPSKKKSNELPFKQLRVGPGLDDGFSSKPTGGYNQATSREYAMPKSVENLRVLNNPKVSYEGRVVSGQKGEVRGQVSKFAKNRVSRVYKNHKDRFLKTGSDHIRGPSMRNKFYAKPVNKNHTEYYGATGSEINKPQKKQAYKKSTRNNYMNPTPRNSNLSNQWKVNNGNNKLSDYGKSTFENKPNERDVTQKRVVVSNVTTEIKKIISPLLDIFKKTKKENFVGNSRPDGNMGANLPPKQTVYDDEDVARTTIKETNIHNNILGNLNTDVKKNQVFDCNDVLRTTIKETNIHSATPNNPTPQKPTSSVVYDPEDVPSTTLKETLIHDTRAGNLQNPNYHSVGAYKTSRVHAKNTHKQFTSDNEYYGVADKKVGKGGGMGYLAAKYNACNTNRQFTSDYEYTGNANSENKAAVSYSSAYNARINPTKEKILKRRAPNKQGPKLKAGSDMFNTQTKKINADIINIREPSEQRVYQLSPTKNNCGLTNTKDKLTENTQRERIDSSILDAFNKNPYTKSLSSVY